MTDMPTRSQEPCLNGLPAKALTDAPTVRFQRNSIEELRFTENRSANPCKSVIVVQKENSERAQDPGPQAVVTKDNPKGRHLCPGLFAPLLELQCATTPRNMARVQMAPSAPQAVAPTQPVTMTQARIAKNKREASRALMRFLRVSGR